MKRIRALAIDRLYLGRYRQTRLANGARSLQGKIFQSREDGDAHLLCSRHYAAVTGFGRCAGKLETTAGKRSATRAFYAHLQALAGRLADCARSHVGGEVTAHLSSRAKRVTSRDMLRHISKIRLSISRCEILRRLRGSG
jgi:hypothetical protein